MNIRIKEKWIKIVIAEDFRARVGNEGFIFDNRIRSMRVIRLYSIKEQIEIRIGIFREMERTPGKDSLSEYEILQRYTR